jgi:hypothetical protein
MLALSVAFTLLPDAVTLREKIKNRWTVSANCPTVAQKKFLLGSRPKVVAFASRTSW